MGVLEVEEFVGVRVYQEWTLKKNGQTNGQAKVSECERAYENECQLQA